jgi:RimJ/RimL family protein N-acetyltransferase
MSVTIRQLQPDDWESFREVRLSALKDRPGSFTATVDSTETITEEFWRRLLDDSRHAVFGIFGTTSLVGITAVFTDRDDPSGSTALLGMSWLAPALRGQGLSRLIYQARIAWARDRKIARIRVSHRAGNEPSRRAMVAHGFRFVRQTSVLWPDGQEADEIHYEMVLT